MSARIAALTDAVDTDDAARSVDAARSSIEKIASAERHVRGKIDEIQNTADPKERRRPLIELNDEYSVLKSIDVIFGELPVLYDLLVNPGYAGAWGSNLIELCDNLLAKSYDWDVQTYPVPCELPREPRARMGPGRADRRARLRRDEYRRGYRRTGRD